MNPVPRPQHRNPLSAAISLVLATAVLSPAIAFAQQAPADPAATGTQADQKKASELDKVTVTGYRYSIQKSLDQKRDANAIVEVITAEDVSKFPDKNVADALQRVPGVVIGRDGGEGKSVSVRGLQPGLTLTQLNGNFIASSETNSEATRSFNYTLMPSNMLSSAELFKTPEARIDEGGIGGTVILHTRKPLDMKSNSGYVSLEGTMSDTRANDRIDTQSSAMYSWHSKDNRFGVLVGATRQKRTNRSMEVSTENWQWYGDDYDNHPATDVNGHPFTQDGVGYWWGQSGFNDQNHPYTGTYQNGWPTGCGYYCNFFMPTSVDFAVRNEHRERTGGQFTFQFRPTDNLTLTANYFRFELKGNYSLNMLKIPEWNLARYAGDGNWPGGRMLDGLTFDPSGTIVTGAQYSMHPGVAYYCNDAQAVAAGKNPGGWGPDDCTIPTPQLTGGYSIEKTTSQTADLGVEWKISPLFSASFKGGRTWSSGGPSMNFRMSAKPRRMVNGVWQPGNTYSAWDLSGTPTMTFSPNLQQTLMNGIAEVDTGSTDSSWVETNVKQNYFQADFSKLFEQGWLDSIQFGAKYTDSKVHRNTGNNYWACVGTDPTNYANRYQAGCDPNAGVAQNYFFLDQPLGNIAVGFNANVFPGINFPGYINYLNSHYGPMQTRIEPDFIYNVGEKVMAGYFQANFKTERLRGNIGLRFVRTKQVAASTDAVESFLDYFMDGPDGNPLPCPAGGAPAGTTCESGFVRLPTGDNSDPNNPVDRKSYALASLNKTYNDILPSFNIAYDLTKNLVLRGAASKVISRPAYTDIAYPGSLSYYSPEYAADRRVAGGTVNPGWYGSGSNKDLRPFEALQYDLGLEWYFHPGAVLGAGLFRKDIKNFIIPVVHDQQMDVGGQSVLVQQYSTQANGRNGTSEGVELYAQYTFDFGLGFQANYTYNKTNYAAVTLGDGTEIGQSPLVGSARNQSNFTVFYETKKFLARASWNRRGEMVGGLDNGLNVYSEPYDQLDLNLGYNFTDQLTLTGSVLNATKSEQRTHLGNDTKDRFYSNNYSGRQMYLGVTWKF